MRVNGRKFFFYPQEELLHLWAEKKETTLTINSKCYTFLTFKLKCIDSYVIFEYNFKCCIKMGFIFNKTCVDA